VIIFFIIKLFDGTKLPGANGLSKANETIGKNDATKRQFRNKLQQLWQLQTFPDGQKKATTWW